MTYRCSGPPPFKPVVGERLILVEEGFPAHAEVGTNLAVRREKATLVITEVSPRISRWQEYSNTERAKFIVARTPTGRGLYISAYIPQTQIVWLDRTPSGGLKTSFATTEDLSAPPLITKETDKLFTTRTQETKAGVVGQVQFEGAIVWESEPFPKGEYDDEGGYYPGDQTALKAAADAKKGAVENLFKNA